MPNPFPPHQPNGRLPLKRERADMGAPALPPVRNGGSAVRGAAGHRGSDIGVSKQGASKHGVSKHGASKQGASKHGASHSGVSRHRGGKIRWCETSCGAKHHALPTTAARMKRRPPQGLAMANWVDALSRAGVCFIPAGATSRIQLNGSGREPYWMPINSSKSLSDNGPIWPPPIS